LSVSIAQQCKNTESSSNQAVLPTTTATTMVLIPMTVTQMQLVLSADHAHAHCLAPLCNIMVLDAQEKGKETISTELHGPSIMPDLTNDLTLAISH